MIKCHIVQDLMPNYVDGLVNPDTMKDIEQHLQVCESCRALHDKLSAPLADPPPADMEELDYLKKVRKRTSKKWIAGGIFLLLIFSLLTYFLAIGSLVDEEDLTYTTSIEGGEWRIHLQLTNGKSLLVRTEPIYDTPGANGIRRVIGIRLKPYQLVPSPLLEKGNDSFMFGGTMSSFAQRAYKVELQMADRTIEFTSDQFVE
ncbi:zf-HC2 domain-containing protein [Paenibacillus apis]|uniref:Anti-sigma-W factor RsiW n=1 Tax=Paenibacillus apis TaxID=1792174 RepID=A0A919XZ71_9BACL|nr:zf-HC2 domain-containing protein [Paenibacillus apis]GIO41702.1 hypothetical protein J41TS4_14600 [Paenibacillus apis]